MWFVASPQVRGRILARRKGQYSNPLDGFRGVLARALPRPNPTYPPDRSLRFANGEMTQADLADRIGVTRQTIIAIEQGRYSPSLEMAFQIAPVFNVPLDEAFHNPDGEGETS